MDELEQHEESGRELILNMILRVNKIQAQGQMEARRNFFFTFIEKECEVLRYAESQERNFERNKKDVRRPEKTFAGREAHGREAHVREAHGRESQGNKNTSNYKKKDIPKFPCSIGSGDKINFGAASN